MPPSKPDAHKILREACDDAEAGRYADALAKHVWFHENALKYQPSLGGVRLSFALTYWADLGKGYPPALQKLKEIRDSAERQLRQGNPPLNATEIFHDFEALNRVLEDRPKTTDLFMWLDANKPKLAVQVFDMAEPGLIHSKQYRLCGKYLDPDKSFAQSVDLYKVNKRLQSNPKVGKQFQDFTERFFSNSITTLVALLVQNDRKADALRIAEKALNERDDASFRQELELAKKGEVPIPWP